MPEGVAKEAKEDVKAKSKEASPRRRPAGNTAKVKVELLDGSTMELDVDRKIRGHDLLGKVCDSLNLVEKDYFGLLYEDRGDPRVWIDLEKRVSKMLKHEPWSVRFAVKFYPPEPAQLQEELTRYQLVLAIRKDLLQGRLPCSTVTHALLASYLLQSELGDYEETEVDAGLCKQLKLVPPSACTPELEAKVVELHKTHRGQTPAEAELNYLENAKKLAMYGVDLHPAKDSENVDITLGVCSSGLLVHREKLRINRFAWPKILKISYKRHNFYVKLRPGEFEQFESTVGFKLANHRAAKKLWKTCVEHHTFFRLMSPEPAQKSTLFPRLGSRFRYSGRTHYESRAAPPQRAPPHFSRTLSNRKLSSRSMDALAAGDKDDTMPPEAAKRHTMPPQPAPRPTVKDKKPPPGAVKVMPTAPPEKDKKLEQRKPAENGTDTSSDPGITNNVETTPKKSRGGFGIFGGKKDKSPKEEKSPRDKSPKSKSPKDKDKKIKDPKAKVAVLDTSLDSANLDSSAEKPSFTKPYEYTDTEKSPSRTKPFIQGAFSYEKEPISEEKQRGLDDSQSPTTRKAGLAFNYAPGEDKKVAESAEKRKTPEDPSKLKTPGIDYVQSAALKEQAKSLIDPTLALLDAERAHHEVPVAVAPVAAKKPENEIQVVIITGRYNPKNKKLDDANGTILVTRGTMNKANGKIQTEKELIDTKSGNVTYIDPVSGKQETKNGHVDSKSGHILFTSGVIDPKTGKLDPTLAQQYCFVERSQDKVGVKPGKEVDLVVITGKYDGKHKKLDASHGHVEVSRAVVGPDAKVISNYGVIDPRTGKIDYYDPKTGKQDPKQAYVDHKTGNILITTGVADPKSGKIDSSLGQQFSIVEKDATKANREVGLVVITSKYDLRSKKLEPTYAHVDSVKGVLSGSDGKIYTDYGIIDPRTGDIQVTDPKTGRQEVKQGQVDPKTGNILLLSGVIDPRTNQLDTTLGQQYSIVDKPTDTFAALPGKEVQLVAVTAKYDSKNKKLDTPNGFVETSRAIISDKDGKVHSNFGILDPNTGKIHFTDQKTGKPDTKQALIDPKTGGFLLTSGVIDPKTGKPDSALAQQLTVVDKDAPRGIPERQVNLVIITSKYDPKNKKLELVGAHVDTFPGKIDIDDKVHTNYGVVDPTSGQIIVTDPVSGKQEVKKAAVDPKTGNLLLTSGVVDPKNGQVDSSLGQQITVVHKPKDTFASVPGKEVQLVSITSKYDPKHRRLDNPNGYVETSRGIVAGDGRVHSNFGVLDPKTGRIEAVDPKTGKQEIKQSVADPKTGHYILTSDVVDPKTGKIDSSLAQQLTVVDKAAPRGVPERYVNLVIVTTKYDPKNKKLDVTDAHIDTVPGTLGSDDKVHTEFGVVDPTTGQITVSDPVTGKQEIKKAMVDPRSGNLLLTSGVVNPKTGQVDPTLGQQISIVDKPTDKFASVPGREVQLVAITNKYDPKNKKLDNPNGHVETSRGIVSTDGKVHSNLGILDPKTGKIEYIDPITGKQEVKQTVTDPKTGHFLVTSGVVDPKTGKTDSSLAQQLAIVDKAAKRVPGKYVNLVIVTTKYDPKNKKLDVTDAHIDTIPGTIGTDFKVHTEFGVVDPTTGQIIVTDPATGKQEIRKATLDSKTGNLLLTSSVVNPKTGQVDPTLGQQISIVDKPIDTFSSVPGREVQLVVITSKYDPKNKKLDNPNGHVETSRGIVGTDGKVHTNLGILDPKTGRIEYVDPKTGRQEVKQAVTDPTTGHFLLTSGVVDPKTGKTDSSLAQQLTVVDKTAKGVPERYVNLVIVTTKYDPKNKKLDLIDAHIDTIPGTLGTDGRVHTEYGIVDPASGQIIIIDPITNKQDVKRATVDPKTGNLLLTSDVINPKTGQIDPTLGQQVSVVVKPKDKFVTVPGKEVQLVIITSKYDLKNKRLDNPNGHVESSRGIIAADGKVHTNFGIIDPKTGRVEHVDPYTGKQEIKQAVIDPKTGHLIITSGVVDPKTGKSDPLLAQQLTVVDKAPREKYVNLVIVTSRYDPKTKKLDLSNINVDTVPGEIGPDNKVHTEFGVVDPTTGQIIVADPVTGKQEVKKAVVDPQTGNLLLTSRVVDPKTGHVDPNLGQQISVVEKPKDVFFTVPGKEIQLVVITNKYDPKNKRLDNPNGHIETSRGIVAADGKVHTNFGVIDRKIGRIEYVDPVTGKHEIKTAVADPKTGQLILTSGVIDPKTGKPDSSLAQQLSIVEKQVKPVQREIHLVIITTKYDPKTKKIDPSQAHVDTVSATIGPDGKIRTAVGVVDPATGEITVTDPITGKQEVKRAQVDPTTGHMLISSNVVDPKTGRVDPTLVQQYSIVNKTVTPHTKPASVGEIRLVVVTSKYDPKTKTVDAGSGSIDASKGYVSAEDGKIHTDFGIIDPKSGQILYKDSLTGKQELKQAEIDPKTGNIIVTSTVIDPKTGKIDPSFAQQLTIVDKQNVLSRVAPITQRVSISPARHIPSPIKTPASTPVQTPLQSPVRTSSPIVSSPMQKASPITTTVQRTAPIKPTTAPPEPPKRKIVKIMVIFTKIDPKTKKPDLHTAEVEHLTGILDPNGLIETKYGVIDSNRGNIVVTDPAGQKQTKDGVILSETGQIFINSGAIDPKTGKIDPNLGMILSVAKQDDPVVEITTITGPIDPRTGKVNIENGSIEHTKGKVDAETGHISTKYGVIDPSNGVIFVTDTTGAQDTKPVQIDENTGQVTITGVIDPKTGKPDPKLGQVLVVGTHIDPVVEVTTFVGKVDSKKGVIEPKNSVIESSTGQFNPENNKIDTKYGQIDLVKGTVTYNDPKTGKFESKEFKVDPVTGQLLLRSGQVNPKSGKPDKDIGRLICLRIIQNKVDPVSGKQIVSNDPKNIKVDPKTNQIWTAGPKDPKTGEVLYTAGQIDPITGYIITIYGRLDPKTGTIVRTTDIDKSFIKVDPVNGQIYTATGEVDENNQPLYSASQVDPSTGEIYTKLGKIDPRTGRLIIIKIYVITQKDDKGRVKEVDPKECTIDETTGRIITTKTVYLYQIIDPITGETIDVDPDDPRLKGARTTVTQTMTLSGKIDPVTGRIKTEYGDIDPDTGDIDPSTAVRDPVTGLLILHYSQIDPSHFEDKSGNYTIEKETQDLPADIDIQTVNTHKFSTFGKDESPARGDAPKSFTEYTTSEHIKHQGYVSSTTPLSSKIPVSQRAKKTPTPPVVVKTTTKQLLTKNDEGVTHNVEQEVENLGTGEVTFSTHTNKAESLEPIEGKSPYVTARAVTTRTATTHHDLDTKAKTQQMEEKTVAHTLTSSATRQEQRVLTQEVKTMVTTGDQEPGSYRTTTTTTVMGNAPFGSMVTGGTTRTSTGPLPTASESPEEPAADGEVVSSQTISSKTRTVETITYKTERNGVIETRVEQKITIQSDGDPIDHDRALAEAIQEATAMNPDMTVEKIEIQQQSTQP